MLLLACRSWVAVQRRPHAAVSAALLLLLLLCGRRRPPVLLLLFLLLLTISCCCCCRLICNGAKAQAALPRHRRPFFQHIAQMIVLLR
jgi:hypothetical protein